MGRTLSWEQHELLDLVWKLQLRRSPSLDDRDALVDAYWNAAFTDRDSMFATERFDTLIGEAEISKEWQAAELPEAQVPRLIGLLTQSDHLWAIPHESAYSPHDPSYRNLNAPIRYMLSLEGVEYTANRLGMELDRAQIEAFWEKPEQHF